MKKISLIALTAAMALFVTSCNKEKTCSCVTEMDGVEMGTTETVIEDGDCSDMDSESTVLGITTSVTCTEK